MRPTLRGKIATTVALGLLGSSALAAAATAFASATAEMRSIDTLITGAANTFKVKSAQRGQDSNRELNAVAVSLVSSSLPQQSVLGVSIGNTIASVPTLTWEQARELCNHPKTLRTTEGPLRAVGRCVKKDNIVVIAATPLQEVNARARQIWALAGLLAVLVSLAGYLFASMALRLLLSPLSDLAHDASLIEKGELEVSNPNKFKSHELRDLASAMSSMARGLKVQIVELEMSAQRMRKLISTTSHELRTPLTVIQGYAQLLAKSTGDDSGATQNAIARINTESHRLERLLGRMLDSQGEIERVPLRDIDIEVGHEVRELIDDLMVLRPDLNFDLAIDDVSVRGDLDLLMHDLSNLKQNLARHTDNQALIQVRLHVDSSRAVLEFEDSGPGIDAPTLLGIHECISRGIPVPSRSGLGLGLLIMNESLVRMGGNLVIDSHAGKTRTQISLPLRSNSDA